MIESETKHNQITLNSLCDIIYDTCSCSKCDKSTFVSTESMIANKGGISIATTVPINGSVNRYRTGDVIVSNIRPYFKKIWLADRSGTCSNDVLVFRPKLCSSEYLYYTLSSDSFFTYVMSSSKGTKMPRGDKESIKHYLCPDHSIEVQNTIVKLIKPLDDVISNNNAINDYLVA